MNLLELFSGIGGFSLGLHQAGFTFDKVYFSEIDRHAIANFTQADNFRNRLNKLMVTFENLMNIPTFTTGF